MEIWYNNVKRVVSRPEKRLSERNSFLPYGTAVFIPEGLRRMITA
ncbi:hypothetical protein [Massiliimalia timonensis]|nr:hypothetical protein [Massiliimalia timonensis]